MPYNDIKTKWPAGMGVRAQVSRIYRALAKITSVQSMVVLVRYQDEEETDNSPQTVIFTAGDRLDAIYDWLKVQLARG